MFKKVFAIFISFIGSLVALISKNSVYFGLCERSDIDCRITYDTAEHIFYFFPVFLLFSILALTSNESWSSWWRYAKFAAPICFALIVAINFGVLHTSTYGTFGFGDMLNQTCDLWALGIIYAAFTLGSIIQIVRGYRAGR